MGHDSTLEERVAVVEERSALLPEIRADIKELLAWKNRQQGFLGGFSSVTTKILAVVAVVISLVGLLLSTH